MIYVFTRHARVRLLIRNITQDMVMQAVEQPDTRGSGYGGRSLAFKAFVEGTIKVVYVHEGERCVIITVMWHYPEEA